MREAGRTAGEPLRAVREGREPGRTPRGREAVELVGLLGRMR